MKVLHILNTATYSGAENVALTIIKNYPEFIEGCYMSLQGDIKEIVQENNIKYIGVNKITVTNIKSVIKTFKPDIIHAHDYTAIIMSVIATYKIPVIGHIHKNVPWMKKINIRSLLVLLFQNKMHKIIMVSEAVYHESWYSEILKKKAEVLGNPINFKKFIYNNKKKKYDLIFVGRLSNEKNPLKFIEIIKKINNLNIKTNNIMIGDGNMKAEVIDQINKYNINNIEVKGFVNNPYEYMAESKIEIIPSKWEGFGLVAVEAMAMGVPVLATNVGGLKDIVADSPSRLMSDDYEDINYLVELISKKEKYKEVSKKTEQYIQRYNNVNDYIDNLVKIYIKELENR